MSAPAEPVAKKRPRRPTFSFVELAIVTFAFVIVSMLMVLPSTSWGEVQQVGESTLILALTLLIGFVQGLFIYPIIYALRWVYFRFWQRSEIESDISKLQKDIQDDFFNNLIKLNFRYLDKYYLQTQVQADKSFLLSSVVAVVSLVLIIVGIVMMFFNQAEPAWITVAAGVLGEFIASVFFYLYNRSIIKMSEYHQKLVLTQNISLALKITDELDDPAKSAARERIIDCLSKDINRYLSSPCPNGAADGSDAKPG